jgi:hypothetical protein
VDAHQDLIAVRMAAEQREGVAEAALDQGLKLSWQGVGLWGRRCGHPLVPLSRVDYGWTGRSPLMITQNPKAGLVSLAVGLPVIHSIWRWMMALDKLPAERLHRRQRPLGVRRQDP